MELLLNNIAIYLMIDESLHCCSLFGIIFLIIVQAACQIIHQENSHSDIPAKAALVFRSNEIQWIYLD